MANLQGLSEIRNMQSLRKMPILPPKSPFQQPPRFYADFSSGHLLGLTGMPVHREGPRHPQQHQRNASENFLMEEQPRWLDDLLNEPEVPVKRSAHRRSTSDSFAYMDALNGSWNLDHVQLDVRSFGHDPGVKNFHRLSADVQSRQVHPLPALAPEKLVQDDSSLDLTGSSERRDMPQTKNTQTDLEIKRAKQQFAQRSRVRKLQYIAELERHVQAMQAEGMECAAQVQFLDQQNFMLNLENKVLKQQLDNLSQEHLVQCMQQEMLDQEIARLRALYHHQQQQKQKQPPVHRRSNSRDLESQLANLTLNHNESISETDDVTRLHHN